MPGDPVHAPFHGSDLPPGHPVLGGGHPAPGKLPPGHPPVARPGAPADAPVEAETGVDLPLVLEGPGGAQELAARLAKAGDHASKPDLERAFRLTFTADKGKRDFAEAAKLLMPLLEDPKLGATAHRIQGYVVVNTGFDVPRVMPHYLKAVELEPEYGEAHYALAFMYAMAERDKGKPHFEKARALGVKDTRGLGTRFYGEGASGTETR
jgi:hypothetical protein